MGRTRSYEHAAARPRRTAAALLLTAGLALLAATGVAAPAMAGLVPVGEPPVGPESDGSCATVPDTYPGNGMPVPVEATCAVVATETGLTVAEAWSWRRPDGIHWYNYLVDGFTEAGGDTLTMCASTDPADAGVFYACTTESSELLFTSSSIFVTWASNGETDLYYCESVNAFDAVAVPVVGRACATIGASAAGAPATQTPTPTPTDEASTPPEPTTEPTTPEPEPPASTEPTVTVPSEVDSEPGSTSAPTAVQNPPAATTPQPTTSAGAASEPGRNVDAAEGVGAVQAVPVGSDAVQVVRDSPFPVALVVLLALALGVGGVGILAGPGLADARRRRH